MKRVSSNPKSNVEAKANRFPSARGVTLSLKAGTLSGVKKQMVKDGISYINDLVQILVLLWSAGRVSKKLASMKPALSGGPFTEKLNIRILQEVLNAAHDTARRAGFQGGASELWRFLLECYTDGRIELCLRKGRDE